ncbi:MAG: hypothetical protein NC231_06070 [Bacillus sp. (in: Bacteria)]|nr:hypothetical protein [Bacillus sp. (in: firmicutes)]MCM1427603.1 hypothetical protein [Eubacterium sp.]
MQSLNIKFAEKMYFLLFAALIFSIFCRGIYRIYGFHIYPDEFGYWVSAAAWNGYDWSAVMATSSLYYSFSYSLILTPILRFSADSVQAYRIAVTVNMILQCIGIGLIHGILTRIYIKLQGIEDAEENLKGDVKKNADKDEQAGKLTAAVGVAVLYPVWTFYMQTTLAEALLCFLYLFICWLLLRFLEKPGIIKMTMLSVLLAYLYFVHMRTVGVVIAAVMTLVFCGWKRPEYRKSIAVGLLVFCAAMAAGFYLQSVIKDTAYVLADAEAMAKNNYAGHFGQLKEIFTLTGILKLLQSCEGKLYYLGMASFGLFYPAAAASIKRAVRGDCFFIFLTLSMAGQFLITAIATSGAKQLDFMIYGRYNEYLIPIFIGIGMLIMLESECPFRIFLKNAGISTLLWIPTLWQAIHSGSDKMTGTHAAGLNYLSNERYGYEVLPEFGKAYGFGILLMLILTGCIIIGRKWKKDIFIIGTLLFMEVLLALRLSQKYIYYSNDLACYNLRIYEYIKDYERKNDTEDMSVYYLHNGRKSAYIGLFQFALKERPIVVIEEKCDKDESPDEAIWEPVIKEGGFILVDKESRYLKKMEEKYTECIKANHYVLFLTE